MGDCVVVIGVDSLRVEFDRRCNTEKNRDTLTIFNPMRTAVYVLSGREWNDWSIPLFVQGGLAYCGSRVL